ncbi:MAG: hypothetical protein NZ899_12910 [Thermoguttaceae bacterium]|nr:hypothetical protein [Thermoguttaceae bacterium]MDW8079970.1 hypothetical protein [Thermoguttaceae bacterium]
MDCAEGAQLEFKPHLRETLTRLGHWLGRQAPDEIFAVFVVRTRALEEFAERYPPGYCEPPNLEDRLNFWEKHLKERSALEDDSIPAAYLSEFDQGLYGALVGGKPQYMAHPENGWISSMVHPILRDRSELDELRFDQSSDAFRQYISWLQAFRTRAEGRFAISHFILINGMNFLFELVGASQSYILLYEDPEWVRRAFDLAFEVNLAVQQAFFQHVPLLVGGTASNMVQWVPGRVISESVDPFHMTRREHFEQWGRPVLEKIFSHFDGGVLHLHGNGRHLLEAVVTVPGLKAIFLGDDRGWPPAVDELPRLQKISGDLPLVVQVPWDLFCQRLQKRELPGGVLYHVVDAPGIQEANRVAEKVRAYRAVG